MTTRMNLCVVLLALAGTNTAQASSANSVEWRVKDRFRLFDQANVKARDGVQALLDALADGPEERLDKHYLLLLETLTGRDGARTDAATLRASNYVPASNDRDRTAGRYRDRYLYPDRYTIEVRVPGIAKGAQRCTVSMGLDTQTGDCADWIAVGAVDGQKLDGDGNAAFVAKVSAADGRVFDLSGTLRDELVVALGDSFISGEGNPDVPSLITTEADPVFERPSWGSKVEPGKHVLRSAEWWDEPCHRSLLSWPVLAGLRYAAMDPHRAVTLVHLGCSGAVTRDITVSGETELPGGGNERLSQLEVLDTMRARPDERWHERKIDKVFASVGGNDIGFARVLATLILPPNGYFFGPAAARLVGKEAGAVCPYDDSGRPLSRLCDTEESAQSRLGRLRSELGVFETRLRQRAPMAQVYRTLYPNPLIAADGSPCNTPMAVNGGARPDSGFEALMGEIKKIGRGPLYRSWNFQLKYSAEADWMTDPLYGLSSAIQCDGRADPGDSEVCQALWVHRELNARVRKSAAAPNFVPVDAHVAAIDKHGICVSKGPVFSLDRIESAKVPGGRRWLWRGGKTPQSFDPYDRDNPRWFRVPNDSITTQFGFFDGKPHFHHGTVHPTFRAHIEYAQAVLDAMAKQKP